VLDPVAGADRLVSIRHLVAVGADDRSVRRAGARGDLVRVRRGAYAGAAGWHELSAGDRYDVRIAAVLATRRSEVVLSHHSAARLWGLPLIDPWPSAVHITENAASRRRTKNGVVVHRLPLEDDRISRIGDIAVTDLARTLVDLARGGTYRDAVAALDFARSQLPTGAVVSEMLADLDAHDVRAKRRVMRAVEFSSELSMSPLESLSRIVMSELGFPPPQLQREFQTRTGMRLVDFWWEAERVAGECDGRVKYTEEQYLHGRTPSDVVWDEKLRETELGELGIRAVRWTWRDCLEPERLAAILRAGGLRQSAAVPRLPRR
jgi:predicted transcriptional regulator of viral defense system